MKRIDMSSLVGLGLLGFLATGAYSQDKKDDNYPSKPIRFIVPFAPGGGTDIIARALAQKLSSTFGQSVVVDNRGGAGGAIGAELGAKATPDGYTLTMVAASYATNAALLKLAYDPVRDITGVSLIGYGPFVVIVNPKLPASNIKELIGLAKAKPNSLNYASTGTGAITHLGMELFNMMTGTRMVQIPYKGTGPALSDIVGGQIQLMLASAPSAIPMLRSKRLRGLAVTSLKRSPALPEIPTVAESGVPGYETIVWYAVMGPKGLPKAIVRLWNDVITKAIEAPDMKQRLAAEAMDIVGGPPARFGDLLKRDIAKWKKVVKQVNVKSTQ